MKIDLLERVRGESSADYIFRVLKASIINLRLPPGCNISEQEIADLLQVSRTPVREAFIKLTQEMLLDVLPQRGTYVSLIDPEQVEESKFLRESLEKEVLKLACGGTFPPEGLELLRQHIGLQEKCMREKDFLQLFALDESMHGAIFAALNKGRIWGAIQQMNSHYNRVRMLNLFYGYNWPLIVEQHRLLVQAIAAGDAAAGEAVLDVHLNKVIIDLRELQQDFSHYFKKQAG
jgi:DNA-binding GntR family transcriptional regulator